MGYRSLPQSAVLLEDVRHARVVRGGGAERDVKHVVRVVRAAVHPPRARLEMHELDARDVVLGDLVHGEHLEGAVRELGAGLERGDRGDGGSHRGGVRRGRGLHGASLMVPEIAHLRGGDPGDATDEDRPATDSVGLSRRERPHGVASLESRGDAGGECRCGADESPRGDHRDPRPVLWRARRRTAPLRISTSSPVLPAGRETWTQLVDAGKHRTESGAGRSHPQTKSAERRAPMMRSRGAAIFEGGEEKRILQKEF